MILTRLKLAGYITLMAGDGTNDVGALKQSHVGIALLDGNQQDLEKLALRLRERQRRKMLEKQEEMRKSWGLPSTAPNASTNMTNTPSMTNRINNGQNNSKNTSKPSLASTMEQFMGEMEDEVPLIKFGDASIAAPFTSKVSSVMSVVNIVRQGRSTLVAMIQMYKILALNSLIMAYSLSVLHLTGVKQGDWQATVAGLLITFCFFGIAKSSVSFFKFI